jgi:hypothetical protein
MKRKKGKIIIVLDDVLAIAPPHAENGGVSIVAKVVSLCLLYYFLQPPR